MFSGNCISVSDLARVPCLVDFADLADLADFADFADLADLADLMLEVREATFFLEEPLLLFLGGILCEDKREKLKGRQANEEFVCLFLLWGK